MQIGTMRGSIEIQEYVTSGVDSLNNPTGTWTEWGEVFCEVTSRRGAEHFDEDTKQRYMQVYYRFRCHYSDVDGINAAMRILYEDKVYDIKNIMPDPMKKDETLIEAVLQE